MSLVRGCSLDFVVGVVNCSLKLLILTSEFVVWRFAYLVTCEASPNARAFASSPSLEERDSNYLRKKHCLEVEITSSYCLDNQIFLRPFHK